MADRNGNGNGQLTSVLNSSLELLKSPEEKLIFLQRATTYLESELASNASYSRSQVWSKISGLMDPRRDIDDECGYPPSSRWIDPRVYQELWEREPVANRIVNVFPRESWQTQPLVYEDENPETATPFEEAWDELGQSLKGESSWHKEEKGSPIYNYLRTVDEQSGIGQYGVLLLGLDDGQDLVTPVTKKSKLLFIRVLPEALAAINLYEKDILSPRYGHPLEYNITFNDALLGQQQTGIGLTTETKKVHWTRVVHIADNRTSSVVFGIPRMKPVLNPVLDIRKTRGGSAEMFWKGAFPGISLETHPQFGGNVKVDQTSIKDAMENYMNGLQRYFLNIGMSAKTLSPTVADPKGHIEVQIEAICIQLAIPIRVFKGSERGELASSQDDMAWNDRLRQRQQEYITPCIIAPFVDRLISLGCLPEPKQYYIYWPDLTSQTAQEKAAIAVSRVDAMSKYVAGGIDALMSPADFYTKVMDFEEDEVESILEGASEYQEEKQEIQIEQQEEQLERDMEQQQTMIDEGLAPNPNPGPGEPNPEPEEEGTEEKESKGDEEPEEEEEEGEEEEPEEEEEEEEVTAQQWTPLVNAKPKTRPKLTGGRWVTVLGRKVYIKGGKAIAGSAEAIKLLKSKPKGQPSGRSGSGPAKAKVATEKDVAYDYKGYKKKLSKGEVKAVNDYSGTNEHFEKINTGMRTGNVPKEYASTFENLKTAIGKGRLSKNTDTYRGLNTDQAIDWQVGQTISDKAFTSVSAKRGIAEIWSKNQLRNHSTVLTIKLPKGTKAIYADAVKGPFQSELILSPNSSFRIVSVKKRSGEKPGTSHTEVIAELVTS